MVDCLAAPRVSLNEEEDNSDGSSMHEGESSGSASARDSAKEAKPQKQPAYRTITIKGLDNMILVFSKLADLEQH